MTSTVCKLLKSLIWEKMMQYLLDNSVSHHQHGFVPDLLETFEAQKDAVDSGFGVDVVYMD